MIGVLLMAMAQAATVPGPTRAATPTVAVAPTATPVALALARAASTWRDRSTALRDTEQVIASRLLQSRSPQRGPGCDPKLPACQAAAAQLAREAAPGLLASQRARYEQWLALVIDGSMTPAEIAEATRFAGTPAGRSFSRALQLLGAPGQMSPALKQRLAQAIAASREPADERTLVDRFYQATASLPRRPLPLAPPAPVAPPQARPPATKR